TPLTFEGQTLYVAFFDPYVLGLYLLYVMTFSSLGIWNCCRLYKIVRASSKPLARRAAGLMVTFTLVLVLGLTTNGLIGVTRLAFPPPLSTLLIFVAGSAYYTLYPIGRERISEAIRMFQARRYSIKAVFLTFHDGTLIGAKTKPGETTIDQDLFGATLDVIQNFMRTSFPILRGKSLSSIVHGTYTLVIEKARYSYLTVVLEGEETDQLRRQMRDVLITFEAQNRPALQKWQGVPSEARGTEELLTGFFVESPLVSAYTWMRPTGEPTTKSLRGFGVNRTIFCRSRISRSRYRALISSIEAYVFESASPSLRSFARYVTATIAAYSLKFQLLWTVPFCE